MGPTLDAGQLVMAITATSKGLTTALAKADKETSAFAKKQGALMDAHSAKMGKLAAMGIGLIVVACVAAFAKLASLGQMFGQVNATLARSTGYTGAKLQELNASFREVYANVEEDAQTVAKAMGTLVERTGAAGRELEALAKTELELAHITEGEVNEQIAQTTRMFGDWSISTDQQAKSLDWLYKISLQTGIGITDLAQTVTWFGAPLRQMGFDFETATAMVGKWEKEGVNITTIFAGMRFALKTFAKAGEDPARAFQEVKAAILGADDATGRLMAAQVFGVKAATDVFAAIKEGRFDVDSLTASLKASGVTIAGVAAGSQTLGDRWKELKHRIQLDLEPVAMKAFGAMNAVFSHLSPKVIEVTVAIVGFVAITTVAGMVMKNFQATMMAMKVPQAIGLLTSGIKGFAQSAYLAASYGPKFFASWAVGGIAAAGPWLGLIAVIGGVTAGLVLLVKHANEVDAKIKAVVGGAKTLVEAEGGTFGAIEEAATTATEKVEAFAQKNRTLIAELRAQSPAGAQSILMAYAVEMQVRGMDAATVQAEIDRLAREAGITMNVPVGVDEEATAANFRKSMVQTAASIQQDFTSYMADALSKGYTDASARAVFVPSKVSQEQMKTWAGALADLGKSGDWKSMFAGLDGLKEYPEVLNSVSQEIMKILNVPFKWQSLTSYQDLLKGIATEPGMSNAAQQWASLALQMEKAKVAGDDFALDSAARQIAALEEASKAVADQTNAVTGLSNAEQQVADDVGLTADQMTEFVDGLGIAKEDIGGLLESLDMTGDQFLSLVDGLGLTTDELKKLKESTKLSTDTLVYMTDKLGLNADEIRAYAPLIEGLATAYGNIAPQQEAWAQALEDSADQAGIAAEKLALHQGKAAEDAKKIGTAAAEGFDAARTSLKKYLEYLREHLGNIVTLGADTTKLMGRLGKLFPEHTPEEVQGVVQQIITDAGTNGGEVVKALLGGTDDEVGRIIQARFDYIATTSEQARATQEARQRAAFAAAAAAAKTPAAAAAPAVPKATWWGGYPPVATATNAWAAYYAPKNYTPTPAQSQAAGALVGVGVALGFTTSPALTTMPATVKTTFNQTDYRGQGLWIGAGVTLGFTTSPALKTLPTSVQTKLAQIDARGIGVGLGAKLQLGLSAQKYNIGIGAKFSFPAGGDDLGGLLSGARVGGLAHSTSDVWNTLKSYYPSAAWMGGYAASGHVNNSDHYTGHAFDVGGSPALMAAMSNTLARNFDAWGLKQIIYNRQQFRGSSWYPYKGSNPHTDHIHTGTYDQGGLLPPGYTLANNQTGRNEHVVTGPNMDDLVASVRDLAMGLRSMAASGNGGGGGSPTVIQVLDTSQVEKARDHGQRFGARI